MPTISLWYTRSPNLGLDPKVPTILGLKAWLFVNLTQLGLELVYTVMKTRDASFDSQFEHFMYENAGGLNITPHFQQTNALIKIMCDL